MAAAAGLAAGSKGVPGGGTAGLVAARVGPVAAVLDPEDVAQVDPGLPRRVAQRVRDRVDQDFGTVSDRRHRGQLLRADDADGVRGDVRGDPGAGRVGQVVAEGDLDAVARRRGPHHHQAGLRHEAEQVRHDGEQLARRARADRHRARLWLVPAVRAAESATGNGNPAEGAGSRHPR